MGLFRPLQAFGIDRACLFSGMARGRPPSLLLPVSGIAGVRSGYYELRSCPVWRRGGEQVRLQPLPPWTSPTCLGVALRRHPPIPSVEGGWWEEAVPSPASCFPYFSSSQPPPCGLLGAVEGSPSLRPQRAQQLLAEPALVDEVSAPTLSPRGLSSELVEYRVATL